MSTITYKYKADDEASFISLAAYVITLPFSVSLFPKYKTISVPEEASKCIGEFINSEGLRFLLRISDIEADEIEELLSDPVSDTFILRDIAESFQADKKGAAALLAKANSEKAELKQQLEKAEINASRFYRDMLEAQRRYERLREQVQSITVLLNSISPTNIF